MATFVCEECKQTYAETGCEYDHYYGEGSGKRLLRFCSQACQALWCAKHRSTVITAIRRPQKTRDLT